MVLLMAVSGALLYACGSDSNDDSDDGGNRPTAAATSDDGSSPTDDGSSDNGDGDSDSELRNLAAGMADKEAKIVYTFTSSEGGTDSTGSFTLFWKPPASWRIDMDMEGEVATIIEKEGTTYICAADGSGGGSCFASPTTLPLPFLGLFTDPNALTNLIDTEIGGINFDKSEETISGQDVTCYSAEGSVEGESGNAEYCFNDDGLLIRLDGGSDAGASFTLEATSVEGSVADADLDLPYEILEIPGQ